MRQPEESSLHIIKARQYPADSRLNPAIYVCAGQICGIEAAIHTTRLTFSVDTIEGALPVDANNSLNLQVALHNVERLFLLVNTYRNPAHLAMSYSLRKHYPGGPTCHAHVCDSNPPSYPASEPICQPGVVR